MLCDDAVVDRLRAAGCVFAEEEAALLLAAAGDVEALVARRVAGEPLEQVLGWAEFAGLRVRVAPGVFVPRRRSEFLVAQALAVRPGSVVVDACCGSGAIGAALLAARPVARAARHRRRPGGRGVRAGEPARGRGRARRRSPGRRCRSRSPGGST